MLHPQTQGVNFINVFCTLFSYESLFGSFSLRSYIRLCGFWSQIRTKNALIKRWWNWRQVIGHGNTRLHLNLGLILLFLIINLSLWKGFIVMTWIFFYFCKGWVKIPNLITLFSRLFLLPFREIFTISEALFINSLSNFGTQILSKLAKH